MDIAQKLVDFEGCGHTATERFALRMEASAEIKRLRARLAMLEAQNKGLLDQFNPPIPPGAWDNGFIRER